ncbi:MAG: maltose ABC transporter permease MalG [Kiritimatiellae bacterium]|nr:maltose ABC transporter permease MalG [Kiritimatiellia bacterium]MBP5786212.1 maltose ABC transporter permease MalG [Kiritimatiellia bacterium]
MKAKTGERLRLIAAHAFLVGFITLVMFPLVMTVSISFRKGNFAATGQGLFPTRETFSLEHWAMVLGRPVTEAGGAAGSGSPVLRWFWNSIKVSASAAALVLLLSATAAYAFARMRFRGRGGLLSGLLILQMFPLVLALVAIYAILETIGRFVPMLGLDTHPGLVLAYLGGIATHIWIIKGYFDSLPESLEESASIDGASPWQTFVHIVLPMSVPIFAVVFILAFIGLIGEYPTASIVLQRTENWTLAVGAASFLYEQNYLWGDFAATAILSGLPITLLFLLCQKLLLSGLTAGGVKE